MIENKEVNNCHSRVSLSGISALEKTKAAEVPDNNLRVRQHKITTQTPDKSFPGWNKAFTLIELLVVVLIIGILSAIALPQYNKAVAKAKAMQLVIAAKAISDAQAEYYLANNVYAEKNDELSISYPLSGTGEFTAGRGTCDISSYSNISGRQRVSCSMSNPSIVLQRYYKSGNVTCCTYPADNYAGDGVCQNLLSTTTWSNGCSDKNPCHCYH